MRNIKFAFELYHWKLKKVKKNIFSDSLLSKMQNPRTLCSWVI